MKNAQTSANAGHEKKKVSVVVPAMNEEETIGLFYSEVKKVTDSLPRYDWELIIVNDGSTDRTEEILLELRAKDESLKIVTFSRNFGSYSAIRAGMECASGDAVICISADLQDPPSLFPSFLEKWEEGHDTVWGVRASRDDPLGKKLLARAFYAVLRRIGLKGIPTNGMDCGLFSRQVIDEFLEIRDKHNITFMTIFWMGFRQARIPYAREGRRAGVTKWTLRRRIRCAIDVMTSFSYVPIRFTSYLGLCISLFGMAAIGVIFYNKMFRDIGFFGWPSLMATLLFMSGIQLIMLGMIGEYLWRVNEEVRGRPEFIVRRSHGVAPPTSLH